jgi:hypothetical protein
MSGGSMKMGIDVTTGFICGHSLKHIAAAMAAWFRLENWEPFQPGRNYEAFAVKIKL